MKRERQDDVKTGARRATREEPRIVRLTPRGVAFSRRRALQALSSIPFVAPLARAMAASPTAPPPKRLVLIMQNNGTQQASFWPKVPSGAATAETSGAAPALPLASPVVSPILDCLFTDAAGSENGLRAKTNLVKGVFMPFDANGTNANQHDVGFARLFTGEKVIAKGRQPWGGGPSVDQIVARGWDADSLTLAVLASSLEPHPKPGFDHRRSFSYVGAGRLKYPLVDPIGVYRKLFATAGSGADVRKRLLMRKSVLDAVAGNLAEVAGRVGRDDAQKVDLHASAIRDVERRLSSTLAQGAGGSCVTRPLAPADLRATDARALVSGEQHVPELVDSMVDLAAVAITCGLTRVATLQLGFCGGKWTFWWQGIDMNCHEFVCHADVGDEGSSPENTKRVVLMNQYYASRVARLATALDRVPERGGSVLDHTLVVWGNEMGRGDHSLSNLPVVTVGFGAHGLPGGRLIDAGEQPFNRLGCSILNLMDHPAAGFGDLPDCGPLRGL